MFLKSILTTTGILALVSVADAQLPYNAVRLFLSSDKSKVYQFSASSFSYLDVSDRLNAESSPTDIHQPIPFQTSLPFTPIADNQGFSVVTGNCQDGSQAAELYKFTFNKQGDSGSWNTVTLSPSTIRVNYLGGGFTFSSNQSAAGSSLYTFGGMCPTSQSNQTSWITAATYSNTMLSLLPLNSQATYQVSQIGTRAPPIAEAGLTITPLPAGSSQSTSGQTSHQQNFVLLGGHTQNAFINMSQVALFSLPEASWAFLGVNQPSGSSSELFRRDDTTVEPRSGHSAVLTEDGTKIIVFGGWVGTVKQPATPQLAVLELGQGYGGSSTWQWLAPKTSGVPLAVGEGIYGHGAIMLPGNIMMVTTGTFITTSKRKRSTANYMFYNVGSNTWSSSYRSSATHSTNGLDSKQKAGIGAGISLGFLAVMAVIITWLLYRKKMKKQRSEREQRLRELAFGSERFHSSSRVGSMNGGRFGNSDMRSASWGNRQEQQIETTGFAFPWSAQNNKFTDRPNGEDAGCGVSRTGIEAPSPTRGLRKNGLTHGPSYTAHAPPVTGPGSVFRIDEVEEETSVRSLRVMTPAARSRLSDPFKDPPNLEPSSAAEERKREVQGWVEDWQEAAVTMNVSRNPSQARTYSNLSQAHSSSEASSYRTGRGSPDKSDRTGSNLSERSQLSIQRSSAAPSRQMSQRSVSAGYALFSGAVAAMGRLGGASRETALERAASKRSISLQGPTMNRTVSGSIRPTYGESRSLLHDPPSPTKSVSEYFSIKDYKNYARTSSMTSQRKKTGILGSVKRVLTGTSNVDVQAQVDHYEERVGDVSPTKPEPEMSETNPGPAFWRGKRGAKDWNDENPGDLQPTSAAPSQRRSTIEPMGDEDDSESDDWDVETAVQKRVVQVMFTVPKEKLRVVNADSLSLISRSDIDEREDKERKTDLKRIESVKEDDGRVSPLAEGEALGLSDGRISPIEDVKGKGKVVRY